MNDQSLEYLKDLFKPFSTDYGHQNIENEAPYRFFKFPPQWVTFVELITFHLSSDPFNLS